MNGDKKNFFSLEANWKSVLTLFVFIFGCCAYYLNASDIKLDCKIEDRVKIVAFEDYKLHQEKKDDKVDTKFDKVLDGMNIMNTRLERVAVKLEERTEK